MNIFGIEWTCKEQHHTKDSSIGKCTNSGHFWSYFDNDLIQVHTNIVNSYEHCNIFGLISHKMPEIFQKIEKIFNYIWIWVQLTAIFTEILGTFQIFSHSPKRLHKFHIFLYSKRPDWFLYRNFSKYVNRGSYHMQENRVVWKSHKTR